MGRILVSVKGGTIGPEYVRELDGTLAAQGAQLGIFVTLKEPTRGVTDAINHGGTYTHPANGQKYPRLQHLTIRELLEGKRPVVPSTERPYIAAERATQRGDSGGLF
jgi:hypothetical protein